ncbi:Predicted outer membrane protein [Arachidicoccus rhizosphaerae]|uniref:Predicted outer membrane protein n=1 Tax=Arachidicoccus rhizosphaerae TaxID=551991 RepID=A0A1H4AJC2_9BACT|nr:DUF4142 domain-containing protein [Arachidicoccus rhizosphaerae]SEA36069.1 Predicted outer membrane protein [Arachidicoccus rhizosphaerae]
MKNFKGYNGISVISFICSILFLAIIILGLGCKGGGNGGRAERNGVDSAMELNKEKIADSTTAISKDDADFMVKAANGGMTEVAAAQIGKEKAASNKVKQFASKMEEDHGKLNSQLVQIAKNLNVTIPSAIDEESQSMIDKLNQTPAAEFDKTFMDMMVKGHDNTVDLFQKASKAVVNPEIHDFITSALPTIESHQQMAKKIQAGL